MAQNLNNSFSGNTNYLSFVGLQNGNSIQSVKAGYVSPSDSAPSWNSFEELQLSAENFVDFESSTYDEEETTSVVSSLHKASKKISKADAKTTQRRAKRARNPWTPKEDAKLMELMKKYGQSWAMISSVMEGRTGKQVRDRYLNKLRPNIKCGDWSAEEDERLITLLREIGNRWSLIATHLPGRTEGQVKNRFYSCIKKRLAGSPSQTSSISRIQSEGFTSFATSPQVEELSFDFQEFDSNMFNFANQSQNQCMVSKPYMREEEFVSDESTAQSPNSQNEVESPFQIGFADPTDVISYDFYNQMPARTYSYGLGPITHDSQIDSMLNKVTDYYVEKSAPISLDVDSFFSSDLNVAPAVAMDDETERYEQLSRRKAYLELALAKTMNEIQGL
jgi:hypothetical protein